MFSISSLVIAGTRCKDMAAKRRLQGGGIVLDLITAVALLTIGALALTKGTFNIPKGGAIALLTIGSIEGFLGLGMLGSVVCGRKILAQL